MGLPTFFLRGNGTCHKNDFVGYNDAGESICECRRGYWAKDSKCRSAFAEALDWELHAIPIGIDLLMGVFAVTFGSFMVYRRCRKDCDRKRCKVSYMLTVSICAVLAIEVMDLVRQTRYLAGYSEWLEFDPFYIHFLIVLFKAQNICAILAMFSAIFLSLDLMRAANSVEKKEGKCLRTFKIAILVYYSLTMIFLPLQQGHFNLTDPMWHVMAAIFPLALIPWIIFIVFSQCHLRRFLQNVEKNTQPSSVVRRVQNFLKVTRYLIALTVIVLGSVTMIAIYVTVDGPESYVWWALILYNLQSVQDILWLLFLFGYPNPFVVCKDRNDEDEEGVADVHWADLGPSIHLLLRYGLLSKHTLDDHAFHQPTLQVTTPIAIRSERVVGLLDSIEFYLTAVGEDEIAHEFQPVMRNNPWAANRPVSKRQANELNLKAEMSMEWAGKWIQESALNGTLPDGMTVDEAAAIQLYTQETCLYRRMNGALRVHDNKEEGLLQPFMPYLRLLLHALNKMELVNAHVYRGVTGLLDEIYGYLPNATFTWWGFSSTSRDQFTAKSFVSRANESTIFRIEAVGVDISPFSCYSSNDGMEREVLMLPGTRMLVTNIEQCNHPTDPAKKQCKIHVRTLFPDREVDEERDSFYPADRRPRRRSSLRRESASPADALGDTPPVPETPLTDMAQDSAIAIQARERMHTAREQLAAKYGGRSAEEGGEKVEDHSAKEGAAVATEGAAVATEGAAAPGDEVPWQLIDLPHPDWEKLQELYNNVFCWR